MYIAIPGNCISGLARNLSRDMVLQSGRLLLVPLIGITIMFSVGFALAKLLKISRRRYGPFMVMFSLSNCIFVGYAMCSELFGEACVPFVMLYFLITSFAMQIVGLMLIRLSGGSDEKTSIKKVLKTFITTPASVAIVVGFVIVFSGIELPGIVNSYLRYLDNIVSPLALVLTGQIIYDIGLKNLKLDIQQIAVLAGRFILAPGICILLCSSFGVSGLPKSVFVVEAAMPVVTQTVVASAEYGADEQFAAQGAAISTIACFIVIPLLMLIL